MGEGPLVVGGLDEVPEEVGLDELAVGGGAETFKIAENHVRLVAIQGRGGAGPAFGPEKADEIEAELGSGQRVKLAVGNRTGQLLPTGTPGPVVGAAAAGAVHDHPRRPGAAWRRAGPEPGRHLSPDG